MRSILLVSQNDIRAQTVANCLTEAGLPPPIRTLHGDLAQWSEHDELFRHANILIVDVDMASEGFSHALDAVLQRHTQLTTVLLSATPTTDMLIAAMRAGVRAVLPWPPQATALAETLARFSTPADPTLQREGKLVAVLSCQGGAGTSVFAANLAHGVATLRYKRVLLMDLTQQFGDCACLVSDKSPPATLADVCKQFDRLDAAMLDACLLPAHPNLDVLAGAGDPIKSADIKAVQIDRILTLLRPQYDLIVCDLGQAVSPVTILTLDRAEWVIPVLQLSVPHLRAGHRLMNLCHSLGYRGGKMQVLINRYRKDGAITLRQLEEALGQKATHTLPDDPLTIENAVNQGIPWLTLAPRSPITRGLVTCIDEIFPAHATTPAPASIFKRWFSPRPIALPGGVTFEH